MQTRSKNIMIVADCYLCLIAAAFFYYYYYFLVKQQIYILEFYIGLYIKKKKKPSNGFREFDSVLY